VLWEIAFSYLKQKHHTWFTLMKILKFFWFTDTYSVGIFWSSIYPSRMRIYHQYLWPVIT